MSWIDGPLLGFDLETTSPVATDARIVTASVIRTANSTTDIAEWVAYPSVEIPEEASAIHGITTEHARQYGQAACDVTTELVDRLTAGWLGGWPVVIYNAPYDLTVLHCEYRRHYGCSWPSVALGPVIDPLVIDKHVDRYRKGSRKLVDICRHYGVTLLEAHTASADALATMRLAWHLCKKYPEIAEMSLADLQAEQAVWYRDGQLSFAQYLRRKASEVSGEQAPETLRRADAVEAAADGWPLAVGL